MITSHRTERDRCANHAEDFQTHPDQVTLCCQRCAEEEARTGTRVVRCAHTEGDAANPA